jgi:hypothetical protein
MLRRLSILALVASLAGEASGDTLVLANGDQLTGEVVEWAVDHVVLEHPQLGRVRLELEQLRIDTGEPPRPGLFGTRFMRGWKRNVNFGLNGKKGNTEVSNLTAGFDFNYTDDWKRWKVDGRYYFNNDEGETTDNNARVSLRRDWLFPESRWFAFLGGTYQYDQFESWEHRVTLSVGPGYHLLQSEKHLVDALLGLSFTREFGERQDDKGEALFGLEYTWSISETHSLRLGSILFTEVVPERGDLRNLTRGEWKIVLAREPALNLLVGAENEWESDVDPGDEANDLKYYLALGLDF